LIILIKNNTHRLSLAGALFSALFMFSLSILNAFGLYTSATKSMEALHLFYRPDVLGTLTGMLEAAVITYVSIFIFVSIYNALDRS